MKNNTRFRNMIILLATAFLFLFNPGSLNAQIDNKGKDFWLMFLPNWSSNGTIQLFITSDVNASGTVSGSTFSTISFTVTANSVTTISLPASLQTHSDGGTSLKSVHVVSNNDVTVYGLNQQPHTTDAYLGLPVDALGTSYRLLAYEAGLAIRMGLVATENSTTIQVTPVGGSTFNVNLNQGQVYSRSYQLNSGTKITSNKPIGVFGGNQCATVPNGYGFCDHLCEMLPPVTTYGTRFGTVPLKSRSNGDTWRFLADQDNTTITINGTAQTAINKGQFIEKILTTSAYITSDKPILVGQYANGSQYSGNPGDPFFMLIPPLEQYLASYTLTTVSGFVKHFINLVVPNSVKGSVVLDGATISSSEFTAIGSSGYSGAQIEISQGAHNLSAPLPFGAFIYGFNTDDSYGYTGGQSFSDIALVTSVTIDPATGTDSIIKSNCWTATVLDQNSNPLENIKVDFDISGANPGFSGFAYTDANGEAEFCYAGTQTGTDEIRAHVAAIGDDATFKWTSACEDPVAKCKNYTMVLSGGVGTLTTAMIDDGSTYDCDVKSWTLSKSAFSCSDNGSTDVVMTIEDVNGNMDKCTASVTVSVIQSAAAGNDRVVYYGAPNEYSCATLTATGTGGEGHQYLWSTGATTQSVTVCPTSTTTYTAIVTDNQGCTANDNVKVCTFDVRCGNNLDNIKICHNTQSNTNPTVDVCISLSALDEHMSNHGDALGTCDGVYTCDDEAPAPSDPNSMISGYSKGDAVSFSVFPNPSAGLTNILFSSPDKQKIEVLMYDMNGKLVAELYNEVTPAKQAMMVSFGDSKNYIGNYIITLKTEKGESFEIPIVRTH